MNYQSLSSRKR